MNEKKHKPNKIRLDELLELKGKTKTRSKAEKYIKMGFVSVNGKVVIKPGLKYDKNADVKITSEKLYVSRAGFKLDSVMRPLGLNFKDKVVLDVGSSTGGFSDLAIQHGAAKIIAVDVGTAQMDEELKTNKKIELREQTDIRDVTKLSQPVDIVLIDVSFISIRKVLEHLPKIIEPKGKIVAMVKPQFESNDAQKNKGVIKNAAIRRKILKEFEMWVSSTYKILNKSDSQITGDKGNLERFYLLQLLRQ